jgi:dTDP-4-dehydrorhamnose reductase
VNEIGAANVARAAAASDIPVVYYSTDYVFGGAKRRPYEVDDAIAPICVYAQSKTAGEEATRAANAKHFIVRTAWLYGPTGNCFPEKMLRLAAERPELKVVDEEIGSPTHTYDLAEATMALVEKAPFGTYHGVNNGSCSRYTFAKRVLELAGVDTPVLPCSSSEFKSKAERPLYSVLSTTAIQSATGYTLRDWEDALAHYMVRRTASEAKG